VYALLHELGEALVRDLAAVLPVDAAIAAVPRRQARGSRRRRET